MSTPYEIKQVIVYRRDLNMRKGKIASQVAHASMAVFFDNRMRVKDLSEGPDVNIAKWQLRNQAAKTLVIPLTEDMAVWVEGSFAKIVLTVENEEDLMRVYTLANEAGLPVSLIIDAGNTEFKQRCPSCEGSGEVGIRVLGVPLPAHGKCQQCGGSGKIGVPTRTAVAVGPAKRDEIDKITGQKGAVPTKLP